METKGKLKGMVYEATLKEGSRIYRVFKEGELLAEGNQKELRYIPQRLADQGMVDIANDMIDSLPSLKRCTCKICGKEFIGISSRSYTCSKECYDESQRNRARKVKKITYDSFAEASKKARELGMSYGKYKAMLFIQNGGARVEL